MRLAVWISNSILYNLDKSRFSSQKQSKWSSVQLCLCPASYFQTSVCVQLPKKRSVSPCIKSISLFLLIRDCCPSVCFTKLLTTKIHIHKEYKLSLSNFQVCLNLERTILSIINSRDASELYLSFHRLGTTTHLSTNLLKSSNSVTVLINEYFLT